MLVKREAFVNINSNNTLIHAVLGIQFVMPSYIVRGSRYNITAPTQVRTTNKLLATYSVSYNASLCNEWSERIEGAPAIPKLLISE